MSRSVTLAAAHFAPLALLVSLFWIVLLGGSVLPPLALPGYAHVYLIVTALSVAASLPISHIASIWFVSEVVWGRRPTPADALRQCRLRTLTRYGWAMTLMIAAVGAGFVAFFIPGIFLATRLALVAHVTVLEGRTGRTALSRSWHLVKGDGWEVFGKLLVLNLPFYVVDRLAARLGDSPPVSLLFLALYVGWSVVQNVGLTLLYYDLRRRRTPARLSAPSAAAPGLERPE